jgi:hypothetical protein
VDLGPHDPDPGSARSEVFDMSDAAGVRLDESTRRTALLAGAAALAVDATYAVFAVAGEPFGTINDVCVGATGVLAGALAWRLRRQTGSAAAVASVVGAGVVVTCTGLVVSGTTGWLLAGFVGMVGFGLIGPSVLIASRRLGADATLSARVSTLGMAAGAVMALGLTATLPVAMRLDDPVTAPAWSWLTFAGSLGSFVLYPAWAILFGRTPQRRTPLIAAEVGASIH